MAKISRAAGPSNVVVNDPDDPSSGVAAYVHRGDPTAPLHAGEFDLARAAVGEGQPGVEESRVADDEAGAAVESDAQQDVEGGDEPSRGNSLEPSTVKPETRQSGESPPSPVPTTANPSSPEATASSSAGSTVGDPTSASKSKGTRATSGK